MRLWSAHRSLEITAVVAVLAPMVVAMAVAMAAAMAMAMVADMVATATVVVMVVMADMATEVDAVAIDKQTSFYVSSSQINPLYIT